MASRKRITQMAWSLMSPDDFVQFRAVEFEESDIPAEELNPSGGWVVYIEARGSGGVAVVSSTVAVESFGAERPTAQDGYQAALFAAVELGEHCASEGYELPAEPPLTMVPLRAEYRART